MTGSEGAAAVTLALGLGMLLLLLARRSPATGSVPVAGLLPPPAPPDAPPAPSGAIIPDSARLLEITAPTVVLTPGVRYLATVNLVGLESLFGTATAVKDKFAELGFNPASVYAPKEAPAFFPERAPLPDGATFLAIGDYRGTPKAHALPSQIKRVWVVVAV